MIREIEPITNKELDQLLEEGISQENTLEELYDRIKDEYHSTIYELCADMEDMTGDDDGVNEIEYDTADVLYIPPGHPNQEELELCQDKISQCREYLEIIVAHQNKHNATWLKTFNAVINE